jgi:hypothetical protein
MHDGGVFFQLVTIKLLYALVLNKHVDTLSIFYVLDPNYIWNFFKGHFFLCQNLFAWSFSGFRVLKFFKALVYQCLSQSFCLRMCFKTHVCWCLSQSSCLPMSISKSYILVCLKAFIYLCLFQSSCLLVCFKILVSMCMSQSSCLPIVCLKALI